MVVVVSTRRGRHLLFTSRCSLLLLLIVLLTINIHNNSPTCLLVVLAQTTTTGTTPLTDESFRTAINAYINDPTSATQTTSYGPIESWDVSLVTDFSKLNLPSEFDKDLSNWNVASGTTMAEVCIL